MPGRPRHADRGVGGPGGVERWLHRDHHLVVVAVVAALDLDDPVPARGPLGDADGVHRRLGAGVGEAPHRQPEAGRQQLGDLGVELARRHVEGAVVELGLHGGAHRRVHVAGEQRPEAHVVVDVLVAVDVHHAGAGGVAHDDRVRLVGLEARRDAEREDLAGPGRGRLRTDGPLDVAGELALGDRSCPLDESAGILPSVDGHSVRRVRGSHRLSLPFAPLRAAPRSDHRTVPPAVGSAAEACCGEREDPWQTVTSHGGRSSARLERQVVALEVGGSSPLAHPNRKCGVRGRPAPYTARPHRRL